MSRSTVTSSCSSSCCAPPSSSSWSSDVSVLQWCPVPCAVDLCLLAQEIWRSSSSCVFSSSRDAPRCRAGWPPLLEVTGTRQSESWPPGGPCQYCAVHPYSVVRRVWGASAMDMFLIFAPPTAPQNLIARILSTPVRCSDHCFYRITRLKAPHLRRQFQCCVCCFLHFCRV